MIFLVSLSCKTLVTESALKVLLATMDFNMVDKAAFPLELFSTSPIRALVALWVTQHFKIYICLFCNLLAKIW